VGSLLRRLAFAPVVLIAVAVVIYGGLRILRPDLYPPSDTWAGGTAHDINRALLHLDLGCAPPGGKTGSSAKPSGHCLTIRTLWGRTMVADIWLLAGSIVIGVVIGVLAGLWCAGHPRSRRSHAMQTVASVFYCAPVYFVGLMLLFLFQPGTGRISVPFFFDATPSWASPLTDPWTWLRTLLIPWLVLAAPLAAMCLRLTMANALEITHEEYIRTAVAKGVTTNRVLRRHVGRPTFGATAAFAPVTLPLFLTNVMLVEKVFSVPGFFHYVWAAIGQNNESVINLPIVTAAALWMTVLLIVLGLLSDLLVNQLDPRVRGAET
jgi:peptide/nickel transport system permease protein